MLNIKKREINQKESRKKKWEETKSTFFNPDTHSHTSVTSDDIATVIVTSYKITEKNIEASEKMMSYNICKTYIVKAESSRL